MADIPNIPQVEIAIVELTNAFRRQEKLGDVRPNAELAATARLFAEYLAKTGRFAHEADGRKPGDRAKASGYKFCTLSENLALNLDSRGFTATALASQAVEGWKNSPGHRKNMVEPGVTEIGVGIAKARDADPKYISVQLFGRPASLRIKFTVHNKTSAAVTYSLASQKHALDPNVIATHSSCQTGNIVFERSGSWLFGSKIESQFTARDGAKFVLSSGADGRIAVDIEQAPAR